MHAAGIYVLLPASPMWILTAVKSFFLKHFANLPALNNFTAFCEIGFSPSLTAALMKLLLYCAARTAY
jgi:hypothetical protein